MDLIEVLDKRFSCKSYNDKRLDDALIYNIINKAILGPNTGNLQAWRFIIVKDTEKKEQLALASLKQMWMTQAPVHIVVCADLDYVKKYYDDRADFYITQDCSIAAENILLLATNYGLSSCWIGAFEEDMVKRALNIPINVVPKVIITLGYSNEAKEKKRYNITSYTFFNEYGNRSLSRGLFPISKHKEIAEERTKNMFSKLKSLFKHSK